MPCPSKCTAWNGRPAAWACSSTADSAAKVGGRSTVRSRTSRAWAVLRSSAPTERNGTSSPPPGRQITRSTRSRSASSAAGSGTRLAGRPLTRTYSAASSTTGRSVRGSRSSSHGRIAAASTSQATSTRTVSSTPRTPVHSSRASAPANTRSNSRVPISASRRSTPAAISGAGSSGYSRKSSRYQRIRSRSSSVMDSPNRLVAGSSGQPASPVTRVVTTCWPSPAVACVNRSTTPTRVRLPPSPVIHRDQPSTVQ